MRAHGVRLSAAGLLPFGHLGWGYHGRAEFLCRATEYLLDGLNRGQRVAFVAEQSVDVLRAELASVDTLRTHPGFAAIDVLCAADYYPFHPGTDVLDAHAALDRYRTAVDDAISAGHTGFRAAVDVTPVARTVEQRDELTVLEYLVDQEMAVRPFSALCAYDLDELSGVGAELLCLHPFVGERMTSFQLHADDDPAVAAVLSGEIDQSAMDVFSATLRRVLPLTPEGALRVDATRLEFITHRQLMLLDELAGQYGRSVTLVTDQRVATRLTDLLALRHVSVHAPSR